MTVSVQREHDMLKNINKWIMQCLERIKPFCGECGKAMRAEPVYKFDRATGKSKVSYYVVACPGSPYSHDRTITNYPPDWMVGDDEIPALFV